MRLVAMRAVYGFLVLVFLLPAVRASDEPNSVTTYPGNFYFYPSVPNTLFLIGEIPSDQLAGANVGNSLRRAIRNHNVNQLVLFSPGGSVSNGLEIAGLIRDKNLSVYVPEGGICFSACSFLFFGGIDRWSNGEVGIHQVHTGQSDKSASLNQTLEHTQYTVADIIAFLNEFGIPPAIYEKMFSTPGNDIYVLSNTELEGIVNGSPRPWHTLADAAVSKAVARQATSDTNQLNREEAELTQLFFLELQTELNRHGCEAGIPDGVPGPKTERALIQFITRTNLELDLDSDVAPDVLLTALRETAPPACKIKPSVTRSERSGSVRREITQSDSAQIESYCTRIFQTPGDVRECVDRETRKARRFASNDLSDLSRSDAAQIESYCSRIFQTPGDVRECVDRESSKAKRFASNDLSGLSRSDAAQVESYCSRIFQTPGDVRECIDREARKAKRFENVNLSGLSKSDAAQIEAYCTRIFQTPGDVRECIDREARKAQRF